MSAPATSSTTAAMASPASAEQATPARRDRGKDELDLLNELIERNARRWCRGTLVQRILEPGDWILLGRLGTSLCRVVLGHSVISVEREAHQLRTPTQVLSRRLTFSTAVVLGADGVRRARPGQRSRSVLARRSPNRRRPRRRTRVVPPGTDLDALADRVRYTGSPEHKDMPTFAGHPRPRSDASICPREHNDIEMVTGWLRSAMRAGSTGGPWEDSPAPTSPAQASTNARWLDRWPQGRRLPAICAAPIG